MVFRGDPGERAKAAHLARLEGLTWQEVAEYAGYANASSAKVEVRAYLQRASLVLTDEEKLEHLHMEVDRLGTLQRAIWDKALEGDIKAVDACVRIINTRAKLLGLETLHETRQTTHKTLIITSDGMAGALQEIAEPIQGELDA